MRVLYSVRADGKVGPYPVPCGGWSCEVCGHQRFEDVAMRLSGCAGEKVWSGMVGSYWAAAARRAVSGRDCLKLTLSDKSLYLVSDQEVSGRAWALQPEGTDGCLGHFINWPHLTPKEARWGGRWDVKTPKEAKEPKLFHDSFASLDSVTRFLKRAGVPFSQTYTDDPAGLAAKLHEAKQQKPSRGKIRLRLSS